jgi:3-oxoacyl-(acyl-carrier-protein) synthase
VGDPEELAAVDRVFCKGRQMPLLIGSVKSNMGHSEAGSGLCSVTKVIIAMEHGFIPPNLHFSNPRQDVEGLLAGHFKVSGIRLTGGNVSSNFEFRHVANMFLIILHMLLMMVYVYV